MKREYSRVLRASGKKGVFDGLFALFSANFRKSFLLQHLLGAKRGENRADLRKKALFLYVLHKKRGKISTKILPKNHSGNMEKLLMYRHLCGTIYRLDVR